MLYAILIFDEPGSTAQRDKCRQRHLDYLQRFDDQTRFAGPFTTGDDGVDLGSFRQMEFSDIKAATKHVEDEPYVINGIQKRWHIHRFETSTPYTWRDCPRTKGNIQVLFHALDNPDAGSLRKENTSANLAYLAKHENTIMSRGPLLADQGEIQIGSLFLLDVEDMTVAEEFKNNMPFYESGLYGNIIFHRWRFGRVFDQFKQ